MLSSCHHRGCSWLYWSLNLNFVNELQAGLSDPDIFFTDRPRECGLGQRNKEYLSIWADDYPVLPAGAGAPPRTPLQAYEEFMVAFKEAFHEQLGTLIEEIVVGSGPCGELR